MQRNRPLSVFVLSVTVLLGVTALGLASAARAEGLGLEGWGVRGGFSSTPDQFVLGMHARLGEFAKNLRFTPNADIGFGDHETVFTLNPDVVYVLNLPEAGILYFGGTISFIYAKLDLPKYVDQYGPYGLSTSDSDVGVAGVMGYEPPMKGLPIFFDLKIGISDKYPDLKAMIGYSFMRE